MIEKNKKVKEARTEKAFKRQKALGIRDSVITCHEKTLATKSQKLSTIKESTRFSREALARAEEELKETKDTIQKVY